MDAMTARLGILEANLRQATRGGDAEEIVKASHALKEAREITGAAHRLATEGAYDFPAVAGWLSTLIAHGYTADQAAHALRPFVSQGVDPSHYVVLVCTAPSLAPSLLAEGRWSRFKRWLIDWRA